MRTIGLILLAASVFTAACAEQPPPPGNGATESQGRRLMPPRSLACARNDLTSFTGLVTAYARTRELTRITIETDADTVERVDLRHRDPANPAADFLVNGQPFSAPDWERIESAPGVLVPGTRVAAWVCLDGKTAPVFDWRPN